VVCPIWFLTLICSCTKEALGALVKELEEKFEYDWTVKTPMSELDFKTKLKKVYFLPFYDIINE
jgi:hypothetical protein